MNYNDLITFFKKSNQKGFTPFFALSSLDSEQFVKVIEYLVENKKIGLSTLNNLLTIFPNDASTAVHILAYKNPKMYFEMIKFMVKTCDDNNCINFLLITPDFKGITPIELMMSKDEIQYLDMLEFLKENNIEILIR